MRCNKNTVATLFAAVLVAIFTVAFGGVATAQPAALQKPILVALGDSFASGQGSGGFTLDPKRPYTGVALPADTSVYEEGTKSTGNECYRATTAYGPIVATSKGYDLRNATCGGATTAGITGTTDRTIGNRNEPIPPQINSVPSNASVVTLTIGGNDVEFVPFVQCVVTTECTETSPETLATQAALGTVRTKIVGVINAIKAKAPGAKVIVTGYPQIVGREGGCALYLSFDENELSNKINKEINIEIKGAAVTAGATYVELYQQGSFGDNSSACSLSPMQQLIPNQPTRKINGIELAFSPANFHPTLFGQRAIAELVGAVTP